MTATPATPQVLLVEDSAPDSLLVREALNDVAVLGALDIAVTTAATLPEALDAVAAGTPDCILLDLSLPGVEGTDALRALHEAVPHTPVVVLTNLDDELTRLQAIAAGAQDYLVKGQVAGAGLGRIVRYAIERERVSRLAYSATASCEEVASAGESPVATTDTAILGIRLPERTIHSWNPAAARLFGYAADEVLGHDIGILIPDDLREEIERAFHALSTGEPVKLETQRLRGDGGDTVATAVAALLEGTRETYEVERELKRGDGRAVWVQVGASIVRDDAGRPLYALGQVHDITERKLAQKAQANLAALVDSSADAIVATDSSRRITAWNGGAEVLFRHSRADVVGRDFALLIPPELREHERMFVDRAMTGQASGAHDARLLRRDGSVVEVSLSTSPIYGDSGDIVGASAIARDITEERAGAAALHASEKRLREIIETANEGIWTLDADWTTTYANQKMADILGTTVESMVGNSVMDFVVDGEGRKETEQQLALRAEGIGAQLEMRLKRADGSEVWTFVSASPLFGSDGSVTGALAMVADITERRAAEHEVEQWQRLESLGQLAGGVAHDMNNLLGVILNFSEFGLDSVGKGPGSEELAEIRQAAERAATLTRQLLVFARKDVVRPQAIDLNELLEEIGNLLRRTIGEHIVLTSHHDVSLPSVNADAGLVEQMVLNLVGNARDAMPDGGQVTITTDLVTVSEDDRPHNEMAAGDYVCLSVADNGEGMTEAVASRAFEPFFTTKPVGSGTGLGLATVYGAVTKAGGHVQLHSQRGQGTEVKAFLPVAGVGAELATTEVEEAPLASSAPGPVLVVEDDSGVRKITVRILERHGYEVVTATGPAEGLELIGSRGGELGLVITDVVMPGMPGVEMARKIGETHPDLPIIFVSGYTDRADELPDGALFLGKPFTSDELLQKVKAARLKPTASGRSNT